MAGKDIIMVRQRELKRHHVIRKVIEGTVTQREAADRIVNRAADPSRREANMGL
jgi:hypothetical protein